jgi:uncharacterized alkaline shock family protein YloU
MSFKLFNLDSSGDVVYGRKVINSIIVLATREISGVAGMVGRGFKAEVNGINIAVEVFISVTIGSSCSDVAFRVQENIKRNIESMTSFKVDVINVNIMGISYKESADKGIV